MSATIAFSIYQAPISASPSQLIAGVELQNQIEDAIEWGYQPAHLQIVLQMLDPTDGLDDEVYGTVLINGTSLKRLRFNEQGNTKQMIKGQRLYAKKKCVPIDFQPMEIEAAFYDEDNISDDLLISFEQEFVPYWKLREALRANPEKVGKKVRLLKKENEHARLSVFALPHKGKC